MRGPVGDPSGMTNDHLRSLLEIVKDAMMFWRFAQDLARAVALDEIVDVVRLGRITTHQKPTGRVKASWQVALSVVWLLEPSPSRMATAVEHATALFQCALTTKFGGECIALQARRSRHSALH